MFVKVTTHCILNIVSQLCRVQWLVNEEPLFIFVLFGVCVEYEYCKVCSFHLVAIIEFLSRQLNFSL